MSLSAKLPAPIDDDSDGPTMGSVDLQVEAAAREIIVEASRRALEIIVASITPENAQRRLLQIERTAKAQRAATMHLGAHVYPDDARGSKTGPFGSAAPGFDRETMGVKMVGELVRLGKGMYETAATPRAIEDLLSASRTAKMIGEEALASRLKDRAESLLATFESPASTDTLVKEATTVIGQAWDAAEGHGLVDSMDDVGVPSDFELGLVDLDEEDFGLPCYYAVNVSDVDLGFDHQPDDFNVEPQEINLVSTKNETL